MFGRNKPYRSGLTYTERNIGKSSPPTDPGNFVSRALHLDPLSQAQRDMKRVHEDATVRRECLARIDLALDELLAKHAATFARMPDWSREVHLRHLSEFTAEAKQEILNAAAPEAVTWVRLRLYKHEDKQLSKYKG